MDNIKDHKKPDYKNKRLVGKVVDNNDPDGFRRLRISIPEIYGSAPTDALPWAIPEYLSNIGNTANAGHFGVPIINSLMYVILQDGDPLFPVWVGMAVTNQTKKALENTNYPHRYGWVDETENHFYVDKQTGDVEFYHESGYTFHINRVGALTITAPNPGSATLICDYIKFVGNLDVTDNVTVGNGSSGTFTSQDGKTITVQDGIVTNIT